MTTRRQRVGLTATLLLGGLVYLVVTMLRAVRPVLPRARSSTRSALA